MTLISLKYQKRIERLKDPLKTKERCFSWVSRAYQIC